MFLIRTITGHNEFKVYADKKGQLFENQQKPQQKMCVRENETQLFKEFQRVKEPR